MNILERVNQAHVTKEDLLTLSEAFDEYRRTHPDVEDEGIAGIGLAVRHAKNDAHKAFAMWSRMSALARLLREEGAHGWTLPHRAPDGSLFVREALFEAAAVQPLAEDGNEFVFERESFLAKALEVAESEARA